MVMPRVLVAEDDPSSARLVVRGLEAEGWDCILEPDGRAAWERFRTDPHSFDIVITDVRMPGLTGIELCELIRRDSDVPIIITSALDEDEQMLAGIEAGADDYLTKPLNLELLRAKARRALERTSRLERPAVFTAGELTLDSAARVVSKGGHQLRLTRIEYGILLFLFSNRGRIVTPSEILQKVWGDEYETELGLLRSAMVRLRRVVEDDPANPQYITTHVGLGYQFTGPTEPLKETRP